MQQKCTHFCRENLHICALKMQTFWQCKSTHFCSENAGIFAVKMHTFLRRSHFPTENAGLFSEQPMINVLFLAHNSETQRPFQMQFRNISTNRKAFVEGVNQ